MDERISQRVPDWLLERLALGELPAAQAEEIRRRLAAEEGGAARLEALRLSNREVLAAHPPRVIAGAIQAKNARLERDGQREGAPRRGLAWGLGLAAPAAAALLVVALSPGVTQTPSAETTRMKGLEPRLVVHRKAGGDAETLSDGATVRAHDLLQLAYVAAGQRYGVIVSLDGGGAVTRHLPAGGTDAAALDGQGATLLPNAYELDDAPTFERFVLVTSDSPFPVETALAAARDIVADAGAATRPLALPEGLKQTSIVLRKAR